MLNVNAYANPVVGIREKECGCGINFEIGAATPALLARSGGRLAERVDFALVVPTSSTARAQEIHLAIGHVVCDMVERALQGET